MTPGEMCCTNYTTDSTSRGWRGPDSGELSCTFGDDGRGGRLHGQDYYRLSGISPPHAAGAEGHPGDWRLPAGALTGL